MERDKFIELIKTYWIFGVAAAAGVGIIAYGIYLAVVPETPKVEILRQAQDKSIDGEVLGKETIYVDVAGAVKRPGVYKLQTESRVGDALVMAGGLAESADRDWVAKNLNLASEIKDGGKIYIPVKLGSQETGEPEGRVVGASVESMLININTASMSELDSLWGIGEARAKAIIEKRPYGSIEELTSRAGIPQNVYEAIKEQISVY